ncbi:Imp21p TDEL_0B02100 [Torulaspora delbrueckii]|uniref:Sugar utilization regulatory protein IMP2 n=1 Tax=Torulaspora delbrueckii TaxID=4950 RepID=G8ZNZ5_TORDE|nr:hypothetical protein TDEL_0B02100 [Torulaspora delbrueckii]CCE90339.1 hypothetical protein TDEL_0B02100 [Torulaspora delbrueckii]
MNKPGYRGILLTGTDGSQSPLNVNDNEPAGGVQFDSEQLERGRSRTKIRNNGSSQLSASSSRSRSRASSRIRDEEFLKWTVLRRDPSMRLQLNQKDDKKSRDEQSDDEDSEELDLEDDVSDEEQVTDVDNDFDIDEEFHYDLGMKVLPNFVQSLNDVLDSSKQWIREFRANTQEPEIPLATLAGGYKRAMLPLSKGKGSTTDRSYILCSDLTSESQYALTYVMGALVSNGDTLYVVHWDNQSSSDADAKLQKNILTIRENVEHMFDSIGAVIEDFDVVVLSLQHPFPKQLLTEMIHGLQPVALCCSLSMILSTLQNYVCSVPTLVIRKKLKRAKKKGISE